MMMLRTGRYPAAESVSVESLATSKSIAIIKEHGYQCALCKFRSRPAKSVPSGFMEVVQISGDDKVLCVLCAQSTLLRRMPDGKMNHGHIFFCHTLTQGQVSDLARYVGLHIHRKTELETTARNFSRLVKDDMVPAVSKVIPGFTSGDPFAFADLLDNIVSPAKNTGLEHLRYWPNPAVYSLVFKFWDAASFSKSSLGLVASV